MDIFLSFNKINLRKSLVFPKRRAGLDCGAHHRGNGLYCPGGPAHLPGDGEEEEEGGGPLPARQTGAYLPPAAAGHCAQGPARGEAHLRRVSEAACPPAFVCNIPTTYSFYRFWGGQSAEWTAAGWACADMGSMPHSTFFSIVCVNCLIFRCGIAGGTPWLCIRVLVLVCTINSCIYTITLSC